MYIKNMENKPLPVFNEAQVQKLRLKVAKDAIKLADRLKDWWDHNTVSLTRVGPHTYEDANGDLHDSDDLQWDCPFCGSNYNEADQSCMSCGQGSPFTVHSVNNGGKEC